MLLCKKHWVAVIHYFNQKRDFDQINLPQELLLDLHIRRLISSIAREDKLDVGRPEIAMHHTQGVQVLQAQD